MMYAVFRNCLTSLDKCIFYPDMMRITVHIILEISQQFFNWVCMMVHARFHFIHKLSACVLWYVQRLTCGRVVEWYSSALLFSKTFKWIDKHALMLVVRRSFYRSTFQSVGNL